MDTNKRSGVVIRSEFTDKNRVTHYVMDKCHFHNDYIYRHPSPSNLLEKKNKLNHVTIKSRPKYDVIITPEDKDPKWLYTNYTGFIKDYNGIDVYVTIYSEKRD